MVSKEKETDGQRTPELSYVSRSSNPVLLKISNLVLFAFYSYLGKLILNLSLFLGQGSKNKTEVAT